MKRHIIMLVTAVAGVFAALHSAAEEKVVEFYFLDPYSLKTQTMSLVDRYNSGSEEYFKQDGVKNNWLLFLLDEKLESDGVVMTPVMAGGSTKPRLFFGGGDTEDTDDIFLNDFRCYRQHKITFDAPAGYVIKKIVMHGKSGSLNKANNCDNIKIDAECGGTQTQSKSVNTWTADGNGLARVSYSIAKKANGENTPTQAIFRIFVTISSSSAIDTITEDNADAPVEYYNLMGVRCDADALAPGIYIRRCGGKSTKVLIR